MKNLPVKCLYWLAPSVALSLLSCVQVTVPPAPELNIDAGTVCTSSGCRCPAAGMANRTYRFTDLKAIAPSNLKTDLNTMWETEISNYITNVMFVIVDANDGADTEVAAFDGMRIVAGPGWRDPGEPYLVEDDFVVTQYRFLSDELQVGLSMVPVVDGFQCEIQNSELASLFFHLGPLDHPLMCAPKLDRPNTTPIKDLEVSFTFSNDCSKIERGHMKGCIPLEDAERICMCLLTATCVETGANDDAEFPDVEDLEGKEYYEPLTDYCNSACGYEYQQHNWLSFGASLETTGLRLDPGCTVNGTDEPGLLLEATFRAEEVTNFDMSSMADVDTLFSSTGD